MVQLHRNRPFFMVENANPQQRNNAPLTVRHDCLLTALSIHSTTLWPSNTTMKMLDQRMDQPQRPGAAAAAIPMRIMELRLCLASPAAVLCDCV